MKIEKETKKVFAFALIALLVLVAVIFAEYLMPEFRISKSTDKMVAVTARNAKEGAVLTAGNFTLTQSELLLNASGLDKGTIKMELYELDEELKVKEDKPTITVWFHSGEKRGGESSLRGPAGTYQVKITCTEQATGTVWLKTVPGR